MFDKAIRPAGPFNPSAAAPVDAPAPFGAILPEDGIVLAVSLAIVAAALFAVSAVGVDLPQPAWFLRNLQFYLLIGAEVLLAVLACRLLIERPASPVRWLMSREVALRVWGNLTKGVPILAVAVLMPAFSTVKSSIGRFHPFTWDSTFIALDRVIHGTDPWRLLQPLMGYPAVTWLASQAYHLWFALIYLGPILIAFYLTNRALRLTFFLAYLATWAIVGMVLAILFASVGPCFVKPILGMSDFAAQAEYLQHANRIHHIAVLDVQEQLLAWYRSHNRGLGSGITAMPSMHVSLAWLYFLVCRRIDRRLGWAALAFAGAIFVSSIHFGYHYAIDGYAGVAVVSVIWIACGRIAAAVLAAFERGAAPAATAES